MSYRWPVRITHATKEAEAPQSAEATITIEAAATDFTVQGIGLNSAQYLEPRTSVRIVVQAGFCGGAATSPEAPPCEIQAEVTYCYKMPTTGRILKGSSNLEWRMGLSFRPRSDAEQRLIDALAKQA